MKNKIFLLSIIFLLYQSITNAQLMTNSNVSITVPAGVQLTVKGDISIDGSTTISNSGFIELTGSWINNASASGFAGNPVGVILFNGVNQSIGGSFPTSFSSVQLKNAGIKSLTQNISVTDISIENVLLDLNSKTLSISNTSSTGIHGILGGILSEDVDNSSKIKWTVNSTFGNHIIPFKNTAGLDIPFNFFLSSGNAGDVTISTYATSAANLPLPITPIAVTNILNVAGANNSANVVDRFWEVDMTGVPVASLNFSWAPAENAANGNSNPRAQRWITPAGWLAPVAGQTNPTTQSVLVSNVTTGGPFTVSLAAAPLPVELIDFTAVGTNQGHVLCNWSTASEINNDYFTVEKSANGFDFFPFTTVDGAGNSTVVLNYQATDSTPYENISYYRLKQTDFNGDFNYSKVVAVKFIDQALYYILYPNPNQGIFDISCDWKKTTTVEVAIFNDFGALVSKQDFNVQPGQNRWHISKPTLTKGVYLIRLHIADKYGSHKFIVE